MGELIAIMEYLAFVFPLLTIDEQTLQDTAADLTANGVKGIGPRRDERRAACREFLSKWRTDCWLKNHADEV